MFSAQAGASQASGPGIQVRRGASPDCVRDDARQSTFELCSTVGSATLLSCWRALLPAGILAGLRLR